MLQHAMSYSLYLLLVCTINIALAFGSSQHLICKTVENVFTDGSTHTSNTPQRLHGPPGKRGQTGVKGEPGIPGLKGEKGLPAFVDPQSIENVLVQKVNEANRELLARIEKLEVFVAKLNSSKSVCIIHWGPSATKGHPKDHQQDSNTHSPRVIGIAFAHGTTWSGRQQKVYFLEKKIEEMEERIQKGEERESKLKLEISLIKSKYEEKEKKLDRKPVDEPEPVDESKPVAQPKPTEENRQEETDRETSCHVKYKQKCFTVILTEKLISYETGKKLCISKGSTLGNVLDSEHRVSLQEYLYSTVPVFRRLYILTGMTYRNATSTFRWSNGEKVPEDVAATIPWTSSYPRTDKTLIVLTLDYFATVINFFNQNPGGVRWHGVLCEN